MCYTNKLIDWLIEPTSGMKASELNHSMIKGLVRYALRTPPQYIEVEKHSLEIL